VSFRARGAGVDRGAEGVTCVVEAGLGGAHRDAEGVGDLGQAEPEEVVEDERCAMVGRDPAQAAVELVAVGEELTAVGQGTVVVRQEAKVGRVTAMSPRLVVAGIDQESAQPGVEPLSVTQRRQVSPGAEERILDRILGAAPIPEDEDGGREQPLGSRGSERRERIGVPVGGCANQVVIGHRVVSRPATLKPVAVHRMASRPPKRFTRGSIGAMSDTLRRVDRLWPDPAPDLELDEAMIGFRPGDPPPDRPLVAINMVTSIDGRAQLEGTAEGLGSRADRRLMRLYRAAFDAVGSGAGTLRATGIWLRVGDDLADRRVSDGRSPNPLGVVLAGSGPIPTDARWFDGDEDRLLVVGRDSPVTEAPDGTELLVSPDPVPEPSWVLGELAARGVRSFLLEGGPSVNASFLRAGLIDEVYWTIGAHLLGTDALRMVAPIPGGSPFAQEPRRGRLTSVLRHEDELYLRYRFDAVGLG
jgi:riboflavin biosynthesis pyrimidine reductase